MQGDRVRLAEFAKVEIRAVRVHAFESYSMDALRTNYPKSKSMSETMPKFVVLTIASGIVGGPMGMVAVLRVE